MNKVPTVCGWFVIILCAIVWSGWQFDIPILRTLLPSAPVTTPLTMLILLMLSIALLISHKVVTEPAAAQWIWVCWALVGAAVLAGVWTGLQYIFRLGPNLEVILYPQLVTQEGGIFPGRPSPHTVISTILVGLSIAASPLPSQFHKRLTMILGLTGLSIAWLALFGYASLTNPFYAVPGNPETGMSPLTALGIVALVVGVIGLRPNEGFMHLLTNSSSGGQLVRLLLPVAMVAPLIFGWIIYSGGAANVLGPAVLFSLSWGGISLLFMALVIWQSFSLHYHDIEREKAAEENRRLFHQIQEAEAKFRTILEAAPDAIVIINENGRIVLVNAQTELLFGYKRAELLNQPVEQLMPHHFQDAHFHHRRQYLSNPQVRPMGNGLELFGLRHDGGEFPVEVSLSPLETAEGRLITAIIRDVTEKNQAANQIKRYNIQLKHQAEALEQSNLELQQFAYVAAHDLQAPLRTINGFMQLLQHHYQGRFDERADDWINRAVNSTKQLEMVIYDILAYSRVDAQTRPFEPTSLNEIFDELTTMLTTTIREARARVTRDNLPTVIGDRPQLTQVLQNLIGNGLKYHSDLPAHIHISAKKEDEHWLIAVRDNGIGIERQHHQRIFEIFRRLHSQQEYPGSGIGLAVCRRVAQRHGGKIWVESELGRGSTFYFTLAEIPQ
ncbi:MAG: PAS domain S-box protein [Anaerolineae bacterium]|nr:PAS domain S-box protein [Anaerolineae bacterium]